MVRHLAEYEALARRLAARPRALAAAQRSVRAARGPCGAGGAGGEVAAPIWRVDYFAGRLEAGLRALWEMQAARPDQRPALSQAQHLNRQGRAGPDAMHCIVPADSGSRPPAAAAQS